MLDGVTTPAWAAWVVGAVRAHDDLDLTLAILCDPAAGGRGRGLFRLYEKLDRRLFRLRPDALEPTDVSAVLAGVSMLHVRPLATHAAEIRLGDEELADIRAHSLDVILDLGCDRLRGNLVTAARLGLWAFHHGDPVRYRGEPPLFWELFHGEPSCRSALEALSDAAPGAVTLYTSVARADPVSLHRSRNPVFWKSAHIALRCLERLATSPTSLPEAAVTPPPVAASRALPSNADTLRHTGRVSARVARRWLARTTSRRQWFLGARRRTEPGLPYENPAPWQPILPPRDRNWADPFVFDRADETYVFLEQLRLSRGKGELAVGRLEADGRLTEPEPILPSPHHLSYPYVFEDGGSVFMVPESSEAARVDLWVARDFPTGWERVGPLLEGVVAADASIVRHGDLYWMWVAVAVPGGQIDDEVFLYYSERLDSGWAAHPRNPVVSDAGRARPAGRPFVHRGFLVRPAQDCTGRYGSRIVFNEVDVLTVEDYRERVIGALGPEWAGVTTLGAHTYTFARRWEATDGLRRVSRRSLAIRAGSRGGRRREDEQALTVGS